MENSDPQNERFLTSQLLTYIGNKRRLRPFIQQALKTVHSRLGKEKFTFLEPFSGTGFVSRIAKQYASFILANDLETYSRITNQCYLANHDTPDFKTLRQINQSLENLYHSHPKKYIISELYAPKDEQLITKNDRVFYTQRNASFLDTVIPEILSYDSTLAPFLLAPILYQASVSANTSGVFKGFYKNKEGIGTFGGNSQNALSRITRPIHMLIPLLSPYSCQVHISQQDANSLVSSLDHTFDIAYIDPPYNQHPYGSNYFMLNLLCNYKKPQSLSKISGIPTHWNRSDYNKKNKAQDTLFDLIANCPARFLLVSYNSEGFIPPDTFIHSMKHLGKLQVMDTRYNTFRGCRNLKNRDIHTREFIFLLDRG